MVVIGLCGGSGSGKTSVTKLFAKRHFHIINTDEVYHRITSAPSECLDELVREFGSEIITSSGALDRKRLSSIVFSDKMRHARLNAIAHRHVLNVVRDEIRALDGTIIAGCVVDAPLLFESGFDKECTATVAVIADEATRVERIMKRDGISCEDAKRRIANQLPNSTLIERCDYVIINNSAKAELDGLVEAIINKINNKNT